MLKALGYAGFGSDKLDDWRTFGTSLLGFQAVERGNSLLAFRMDDRKQRVVIDRAMGDGAASSAGKLRMPPRSMRSRRSWRAWALLSPPSRKRWPMRGASPR